MLLKDKVVIITGGAQGLGQAFADILLEHGSKVSFCDINEEKGDETLKYLQSIHDVNRVMFVKCDVRNQSEMADFFMKTKTRFGGIDIVINNAGVGGETTMWEQTVDINLKGMIRGSLLALDYLRTDKGGSGGVIMNVSSAAGLRENPLCPIYCASKSGVLAFSKSLACNEDNINNNVRINVLCPAFVDTALVTGISSDECLNLTKGKALIDAVGIMATREVAEQMLELLTDDQKNGAVLNMSKLMGKEYVSLEWKKLET